MMEMNEKKQDKPDDPPYAGGEDEGSDEHQAVPNWIRRARGNAADERDDGAEIGPDESERRPLAPNGKRHSITPR
jgi:hypothetical protein